MYRTLGTPDDDMWPKVSELPNYKTQFPKWKRQPLGRSVARLCPNGVDLLSVSECDKEPGTRSGEKLAWQTRGSEMGALHRDISSHRVACSPTFLSSPSHPSAS